MSIKSAAPDPTSKLPADAKTMGDRKSQQYSAMLPSSLTSSRRGINQYWRKKIVSMAIILGVVPVMVVGAVTTWMGTQALQQERQRISQTTSSTSNSWLVLMLSATGLGAVLSGGVLWLWFKLLVNAIVQQSTRVTAQVDQTLLSESLQDIGRTVGLLQSADSLKMLLDIGVTQVQGLLNAERVFILSASILDSALYNAEAVAPATARLLDQDWSHLEVPLTKLFAIPMGYVQVCSEVRGSDLALKHQAALTTLGVQAQMVTQITQESGPIGVLVVQQLSQPREWTEVEHQLFAALAKQIGLAIERYQRASQRQVGGTTALAPVLPTGLAHFWNEYEAISSDLTTNVEAQVTSFEETLGRLQSLADVSQSLSTSVKQVHQNAQHCQPLMRDGQVALDRSLRSVTEVQETIARATMGTQHLNELCQQINQVSHQIKTASDQLNYQAMNASITAGRQPEASTEWNVGFTNQILELTRDLKRQTLELETVSSHIVNESQTVSIAIDTGNEQVLVGAEWFKETRQLFDQLMSVQRQLESLTQRSLAASHDQVNEVNGIHQQMMDMANQVNHTVDRTHAMARSLAQFSQQAPA